MIGSPWEVTLDQIYYRAFFQHNPLRAWIIPESQTTSFWDMCLLSASWLSKVLWEQSRARDGNIRHPYVYVATDKLYDFSKWFELGYKMEKTT